VEHKQEVQLHSNFGIGIEREIYSKPYFSYHYGYRYLSQMNSSNEKSKIFYFEKVLREKFEHIDFHIIFLNISSKGNFINFVVKDRKNLDSLGIIPIRDANSFSMNIENIFEKNIDHREIFPRPNLDDFNIAKSTLNTINDTISKFCPIFYCIGFDSCNGKLNYNNVHLELYPEKNIVGLEEFINILKTYGINTNSFEKYFLNFKKFSHVKFKIENGEIKNIKYYRSINVNIPEFYYG